MSRPNVFRVNIEHQILRQPDNAIQGVISEESSIGTSTNGDNGLEVDKVGEIA